ncbi:MAG TPA: DUF922 domain-containing protein [Bacteroidia bacterium]|nr:DUF922 domain-containing protein [Bacteroidia bacterium]
MKFIYAILLLTLLSFTQSDKANLIPWSKDYKLQWADFTGKPAGSLKALTSSSINFETKKADAGGITLLINTYFIKDKSWRQKDFTDDFVLQHEQTHFDITEVYARKLRKKLSEAKYTDIKKAMPEIQKTYNEIFSESRAYQKKYDEETNHSINKDVQIKWNKKVADELQSLNAYTNPEVNMVIKK